MRGSYSCFLVYLIVFIGCSPKERWVKNQNVGEAFGTTYSIIYLAHEELNYQKEIDSVIKAVNKSMSTYMPDSDISRINSGDTTIQVDHMFKDVFALSKEIHAKSKGNFDPTVGVLANAWGFGPGRKLTMDQGKVDSLLQFVGFSKVRLNANSTVTKEKEGIAFDFNSIAKGYSIDRLAAMLAEKGIQNYLVEVGGEVVGKGSNRLMIRDWGVAIDDPQVEDGRRTKKAIHLVNRAMASSGNYRKFWVDEATGKKYVHTINPLTGYPKNGNILAATVLADNCAKADAYATTFMAMDLEDSKKLIAQENLDAYIIYLDDAGNTLEFMTDGFKEVVIQN
ncbi:MULTISPECIES: FAD:protein FMN transferase [Flavobacteriaceae]|uniref:FAD:protein FMN transferase n=1 Tax=Flavobacteriaceae TaxID=49546 RepID=UPI0010ADB2E2|nr:MULTISPECIES: FAD:protein FMN transferase [Flavobacteriaceae]NJB36032.1 FAD:protein FMN transferase [Croceivirga sp. JEA036]TKD59168.1 FAD:protein FMN transferase [Flavobacterium sp. ASW18X]